MKTLGTVLAVVLGAGVAAAQQQPSYPGSQPDSGGQQGTTGEKAKDKNEFRAEVVSTNTQAKTITVRRSDTSAAGGSSEMTLPVDSKAESSLAKVNAGDHVHVVCRTDSSGKQIVSKIDRVDTRPAGGGEPSYPPNP